MKYLILLAGAFALTATALARDHGPAFGYSTPVNSQREWSYDTGLIGRYGNRGTAMTSSSAIGYGITPQIMMSAIIPATFGSGALPETRLAGGGEWETNVAWRFDHRITGVGQRLESTASLGLVVPGPQSGDGILANLHRAPGVSSTIATGFASRVQYLWLGGGYTRFALAGHDRRPDTLSWSAVYGYRPAKLRRGVDSWDSRGFLELTGEHTGGVLSNGQVRPASDTTTLWLGPSVLSIHRDVAIEAGVQAPLYRDVNAQLYGREQLRFVVNISYLKYSSHTDSH